MQNSISKMFGSVKTFITLLIILSFLLLLTIVSEYTSFFKLQNLQNEKEIATTVYNLDRSDLDLANIQFRGKNTLLRHEGNALKGYYEYDYINNFSKKNNYYNDLSKLQNAINIFNKAAGDWFTQESISQEQQQENSETFAEAYQYLMQQINTLIVKNVVFEKQRFQIQLVLSSVIFLLLIILYFMSSSRFKMVQNDFNALTQSNIDDTHTFLTVEAEAVSKHLNHSTKSAPAKNPIYTDQLTGINSHKGFINEYNSKKSQKLDNYTAICVFAIDKLSEMEMQYGEAFSAVIIEKVSFMMSLYSQRNDIIGRIDRNQFAIFISRQDKTTAINDCELIRKSVEETPFKSPDGTSIKITLSGGFVQKMMTQPLNEVMTKANKVLSMSIQHGGNRIAQLRDKSTALK